MKLLIAVLGISFVSAAFSMQYSEHIIRGNNIATNVARLNQQIWILSRDIDLKRKSKRTIKNEATKYHNSMLSLMKQWKENGSIMKTDNADIYNEFNKLLNTFSFASKGSGYGIELFDLKKTQQALKESYMDFISIK